MSELRPLTEKQAAIKQWADRGYTTAEIAKVLGSRPSIVADQVGLIRKKGYEISLTPATGRRLDPVEAQRIAAAARPMEVER